ncbi:LacI family DNA-binding transcriptional regulator [Planococcus shenhongbingii]|uniref:LacI family DNA-binding transcriptional regulator n=1 Tax=Planococcus shenhongbingii TaxID=3058398 RepID=A0ABT8NAN5_9BACL|nr:MULTISPECIES: LacI family DNA-binding transcriptional regulator [unclassified Planococcus (in: firmicutes)]MDN7244961.1 LacI family DNA-binding transcriptional regulator [Planococcus sp. N017]WKA58061.1 LacI family DNA-binding transcriptional regulator [Planococcus sp. N016]
MTTIRDVAKKAGVSVATVSRYLNDSGYVSGEAARAVADAVKELKYELNPVARSLNTKKTNIIGLIVPDITNPFFPELARAVEDVALTYGYTVILCNSDENPEKEKNYIETLRKKYIDGFIVTSNQLDAPHYANIPLPIVALDRAINANIPTVASNNREGAGIGTRALLERGCKKILFLRGPEELNPANDRYEGFMDVIRHSGIEHHVAICPFHFTESEKIVESILQEQKDIDGIFASSDVSAAGALKAANTLGISVPDELQIVGFDGIAMGEMLSPGLTTVAQDIYKMGAIATRVLIKRIENQTEEQHFYEVPVELKIRGTTRSVEE